MRVGCRVTGLVTGTQGEEGFPRALPVLQPTQTHFAGMVSAEVGL